MCSSVPANRNLRKVKEENYLRTQKDSAPHLDSEFFESLPFQRFDQAKYVRGLAEHEVPMPISAQLGPFEVQSNLYRGSGFVVDHKRLGD